jgi:hypothetical protein
MGDQFNARGPARSRNRDRKRAAPNEYDPILPCQYYERVVGGRAPSGEFKLFFAILEDALRCYVRAKDCRSAVKRAEFLDAQTWFHTRGTPCLFSFESVCSFLGIDPQWLRERLESLTPTDIPLKQYRTRRHRVARPSAARGKRPPAEATQVPNHYNGEETIDATSLESRDPIPIEDSTSSETDREITD